MSSVQRNMKRVNLAFLPLTSDNILAQVLQEPPNNHIQYAAASSIHLHLKPPGIQRVDKGHSVKKAFRDITIYLTKPQQYFFVVKSHIGHTFFTKMWTTTSTIGNNKMKYVSLITTLNRFPVRTASELSVNKWYRYNKNAGTTNNDQQSLIKTPYKIQ